MLSSESERSDTRIPPNQCSTFLSSHSSVACVRGERSLRSLRCSCHLHPSSGTVRFSGFANPSSSSRRYSSSALLASDFVPCTVLLGDLRYLPVLGSLPRWCLMR